MSGATHGNVESLCNTLMVNLIPLVGTVFDKPEELIANSLDYASSLELFPGTEDKGLIQRECLKHIFSSLEDFRNTVENPPDHTTASRKRKKNRRSSADL